MDGAKTNEHLEEIENDDPELSTNLVGLSDSRQYTPVSIEADAPSLN